MAAESKRARNMVYVSAQVCCSERQWAAVARKLKKVEMACGAEADGFQRGCDCAQGCSSLDPAVDMEIFWNVPMNRVAVFLARVFRFRVIKSVNAEKISDDARQPRQKQYR
jgi:hypothetical protein